MSQTPQPSTIPADHSPTITKFSSCIASNVQAICVAFTNFKQFYLHSLWTGEENVTVKTATGIFNRYALNIYTIYTKPRLIASSALHVESPRVQNPTRIRPHGHQNPLPRSKSLLLDTHPSSPTDTGGLWRANRLFLAKKSFKKNPAAYDQLSSAAGAMGQTLPPVRISSHTHPRPD